ncbi:hypothetical protein LPICM02_350033 [Pseudolactococcus piscium]|nr:hypothetical protein LPICM02_350033 [Lactococcus piscium]
MKKLMDKDTVDKVLCKIKQDGITSIGRVILFGGELF